MIPPSPDELPGRLPGQTHCAFYRFTRLKDPEQVASVLREESGILPLPFRAAPPPPPTGPLLAGYRGGWFHPATSYSFPVVLRLADYVASVPPDELYGPGFAALVHAHRQQAAFMHRLNWLLFRGSPVAGSGWVQLEPKPAPGAECKLQLLGVPGSFGPVTAAVRQVDCTVATNRIDCMVKERE